MGAGRDNPFRKMRRPYQGKILLPGVRIPQAFLLMPEAGATWNISSENPGKKTGVPVRGLVRPLTDRRGGGDGAEAHITFNEEKGGRNRGWKYANGEDP